MLNEPKQQELDITAYALAKTFILHSGVEGVTPELVHRYLRLSTPRPSTLAGLYERLLASAQNANMKAGVIGGSIGGVHRLGRVLCDFEPGEVLQKYVSRKSTKKLQEQCSGLGQLTLSVDYDVVVMRPEICIGAWDRYPLYHLCEIPVPSLGG